MQQTQTIKIFLGSSITELKNAREEIAAHITNDITNLFGLGNIAIKFEVCEDIHRDYMGGMTDQDKIDNLLRSCDVSVFLIKEKVGDKTVHEYDVAKELQKEKPEHKIYIYFLKTQDGKKSESVKAFQKRLMEEDFYWKDCDSLGNVKYDLLNGLLRRLGYQGSSEKTESIVQTAEARFEQFKNHKKQQDLLKKELHKDIEDLLAQTKEIMSDKDTLITARIAKTLDIYRKADRWAAATAYDKEKYSDLLFNYGQFLYKYGLYRDAETVWLRQIPLAVELYGTEHENTATSYNEIGLVYWRQGDYGKALEYYQKALGIREKVLGTDQSDTAQSYNNIGEVHHAQGDYDKAMEYYQKALAIDEHVLGSEHPYTATSYNNIGTVYDDQGDYGKALEYYQKALEIKERVLGTEHPSTATSYNNIGRLYKEHCDYGKSLVYYQKALAIKEKALGTEHPSTATSYNDIGVVYDNQGDYVNALEFLQKALEIREKFLGTEHPDTAQSYNNIGEVYREQGDYDKSLEYYQKALAIREFVFGPRHPDTAQSYNSIGSVYFSQGEYGKALEYDVKALAIMEKVLGGEHPYTAQSYNSIGLVYKEQGDYSKALAYLNKAYQIYGKTLGQNHPYTKSVAEWITITTSISRGNMQKLPIGIQSFEKLRKSECAYVDKTQLVFDLVRKENYVFLSRPRRFGKSLFMSTLKAYFEGKKELFEDLAISKLEQNWEPFPVLYMDLNASKYDSVEDLLGMLNFNLNKWEKKFGIKSDLTDVALRFNSIIQEVAEIEHRNVVILVDEYDKPLLQAIDNESLQQDFRNILKAFFSNLKTCDEFIRFAMLTGVSKFSKISLFSDLNNLNDISLNEHYSKICGLTEDDIYQTFSVYLDDFVKHENTNKTTLMDKMRQMYGGYHFSGNTSNDIYNPFSVLKAFSEMRLDKHWFSTGTPSFLIKLLQKGDYDLQKFSEGNIKTNNLAAKESLSEDPISVFYQTGYLTIKEHSKESDNYNLGFPNREVEQGFLSFLLPRYLGNTEERTTTFLDDIMRDLRKGHIEDLMERMKSFFANTPYELIRDLENHYQNVMFTICRLTGYKTEAEYHTSYGRIDMVVKTEKFIYVFEFKFNKTAQEALEQIDTKEYLLPFSYDGRKLCKIGVNFSGVTNNIDDYDYKWVKTKQVKQKHTTSSRHQ